MAGDTLLPLTSSDGLLDKQPAWEVEGWDLDITTSSECRADMAIFLVSKLLTLDLGATFG